MRVHPTTTVVEAEHTKISARVQWDGVKPEVPDVLTFKLPSSFSKYPAGNMNGFLTALLPVAMFAGEDIHIQGAISEKLLYGLREFQRVLHFWYPQWFSIVTISADSTTTICSETTAGVMSSFSGGADSMYTFVSHLPENEPLPAHQVTHSLFIEAFDTPIISEATQAQKVTTHAQLMKKLDIGFVPVSTNAKEFYYFNIEEAMAVTYTAILIGTAQLTEGVIKSFYFSADNTHDFPLISTISHTLVPLMSSDNLHVSVYGASVTKMEKLEKLITWPPSYEHLTVCWENPNGLKNCGKCVKCCHTTAGLDMLNALHLYSTFPPTVFRNKIRSRFQQPHFFYFTKTWIRFSKKYQRSDYVFDFTFVLWRNRFIYYILKPIKRVLMAPLHLAFALSARLKQASPNYAKCIYWIKKT